MRKLSLLLVGALFMVVHATAQDNLKKVEGTGIHTSDEVYMNDEGEYFAKVFYITFNQHATSDIYQAKNIRRSNVLLVTKLRLGNAHWEAPVSHFSN